MKKYASVNVYVSNDFKHKLLAAKLDLSAIARRAWGEALDGGRQDRLAMVREYGPYVEPVKRKWP